MKTSLFSLVLAGIFSVTTKSTDAQSLGSAADYDIFVTNNGTIELKDANQLYGRIGYSNGVTAKTNETVQNFDGAVYVHSGADFEYDATTFNPSGGIFTTGFDTALNQANADIVSYVNYLGGLSSDFGYTEDQKTAFSLSSTSALTVVDFRKVNMAAADFSFTGRAGLTDKFIIRISDDFTFEDGSVNLTNVDSKNVVWYLSMNKTFNLHRGIGNFDGTILAPLGDVVLGEPTFKGAVYGSDLKFGSGFTFEGNTVPEPSSSLVLLSGIGVLLLIRRRK